MISVIGKTKLGPKLGGWKMDPHLKKHHKAASDSAMNSETTVLLVGGFNSRPKLIT